MELIFSKYQGTGNDFIILDNRDGRYTHLTKKEVAALCHRRFGIGADGLMLLNTLAGYHFEMKYYNADGAESTMCGNGGRCLAAFAKACGIAADEYRFMAIDGPHLARVAADGTVALKMNDVNAIQSGENFSVLNTGSPHYVTVCSGLASADVKSLGAGIRNSAPYKAEGINVNFVEPEAGSGIFVRTFERGVEDETFSCGTGVTAAAIISGGNIEGEATIPVRTLGGNLQVTFNKTGDRYTNVWLIGPAEKVFEGTINIPLHAAI